MPASESATAMAEAASRLLECLSPDQRKRATRPFTVEGERREWYYTPNSRPGIPLIELDPRQRQRARQLLRTGLSKGGYNTAIAIMGNEGIVDEFEGWRQGPYLGYDGPVPSLWRDSNMYFVCVFGEAGGSPWGWSFGGHHISLHHTVVEGQLATPTPSFFGIDPAESPLGHGHTQRVLGAEQDRGLELFNSLSPAQREVALIAPYAPDDIIMSNRPKVEEGVLSIPLWQMMGPGGIAADAEPALMARWERHLARRSPAEQARLRYTGTPQGIAASALTASQQDGFRELLHVYIDRMPDAIAEEHWARVQTAFPSLHFAWAGASERYSAHYYRVQGPRVLVEYDNINPDGSHIHSVWRDPEGDFGGDVLAKHYAEAHR